MSYLTILDIYLWVCFFFVFSTTCYCCIINYLMTAHQDHELVQKKWLKSVRRNSILGKFRGSVINQNLHDSHGSCHKVQIVQGQSNITRRRPSLTDRVNVSYKRYETRRQRVWKNFIQTLYTSKIRTIDSFFRLYYYISFLTFNMIYWVFCVVITQHAPEKTNQ